MDERGETETCPFQDCLELLGRRHVLSILWALRQASPRRFTELKRATSVNAVTLTQRLQELQRAGVVERRVYNELPPRVEYGLTPKGRDLLVIMDQLEQWSKKYPQVVVARAR